MNDSNSKYLSSDSKMWSQEWLVTNGLGGYACGSLGGAPMRKYNALLVAALKAPHGRTIMLNYVADSLVFDGNEVNLSQLRIKNENEVLPSEKIEFKLLNNLPIWKFHIGDTILEKTIWMSHGQNTTYIRYHLISAKEPIQLKWRPFLHFRNTEQDVNVNPNQVFNVHTHLPGYEIETEGFPSLKLVDDMNSAFVVNYQNLDQVFYEIEEKRGYEHYGSLTSPGFYLAQLNPGEKVTFIATTESWHVLDALTPYEAFTAENQRLKGLLKVSKPLSNHKFAKKLILAADQFIIMPSTRELDVIRLRAMGEEARSIIAGYPWFTDWGRDTMIALEGLCLTTGRPDVANAILRTFAYYIRDGLIPNMFPDGENEGLYHTSDATLWFFHAVDRYVTLTEDEDFLEFIIPKFQNIISTHIKGTLFGIKVDSDGLLQQGQEGYQLTWMDAKVKEWVVTPRRGKAVEINALWYNALKLMERWTGKKIDLAEQCYDSFNKKFWYQDGGYLYDVINGKSDLSLRPNQIFAISLRFPILKNEYWEQVVNTVKKELLTGYGLRTLSSSHPDYKAIYDGDLLARDAAYHQGTVWPWLIGPFIDAWLKTYPDKIEEAKKFLYLLEEHIDESCTGTINEVFDAEDPFLPRGCFAQAWSVAEYLRAFKKLNPEINIGK